MQTIKHVQVESTPRSALPWSASIAIDFRRKRFAFFKSLIASLPTPRWGWKAAHIEELSTIRLMSEKEMRTFFLRARVYKENFLDLTMSFIVYRGR